MTEHQAPWPDGEVLAGIVERMTFHNAESGFAVLLMAGMSRLYPRLRKLYADGGYQGSKFRHGLRHACRRVKAEILRRRDSGRFTVLPKRWIVERTIGWLNRCRRLAKDWECLDRNRPAFLQWASVRRMLRSLCQN